MSGRYRGEGVCARAPFREGTARGGGAQGRRTPGAPHAGWLWHTGYGTWIGLYLTGYLYRGVLHRDKTRLTREAVGRARELHGVFAAWTPETESGSGRIAADLRPQLELRTVRAENEFCYTAFRSTHMT